MLLGYLLKRRGDTQSAADAFRRAEARGHREAGSSLGNLLSDNGDIDRAKAAYERSIAAGSTDAALNLGLMLAQQGAADEALRHLRVAQDNGDPVASWAIGKLLEDRDDLTGAADAYRQGADGGNADAAYGLGSVLMKLGDGSGARAAFQRARDLGHSGAGELLQAFDRDRVFEELDRETAARAAAEEAGAESARRYAAACGEVLTTYKACLEAANGAVGARNMIAQQPMHELSVKSFTSHAKMCEQKFASLYPGFDKACTAARNAAEQFLATQPDPSTAEVVLLSSVDEEMLNDVATVKAVLSVNYKPTPAGFVQGLQEANELIMVRNASPGEGNIYRPPPPTERACPWCAETIKVAAVICRFCGRDVQDQPS